MSSILKPEGSLTLGVGVAAMVYGVYAFSVPNSAMVHATDAHDINIESGRKKAAWTSAAVVAAVALLARDKTIFILGGGLLVLLDFHTRHANSSHPDTGQLVSNAAGYTPAQYMAPQSTYEATDPGY